MACIEWVINYKFLPSSSSRGPVYSLRLVFVVSEEGRLEQKDRVVVVVLYFRLSRQLLFPREVFLQRRRFVVTERSARSVGW